MATDREIADAARRFYEARRDEMKAHKRWIKCSTPADGQIYGELVLARNEHAVALNAFDKLMEDDNNAPRKTDD